MLSKKPFRVHLFKLVQDEDLTPLDALLRSAQLHPLDSRVRKLGTQEYRLEVIEPPTDKIPFWQLDFCKLRYDGGPGKASRDTPIESIDLEDGEGFAEETAVLYDPGRGYLAIQYNHHGPRSGAIAEYLSIFDPDQVNQYEFHLQLNPNAQARLDGKKVFTKLEIKVAPAKLTKAFKKANIALSTALERDQQQFGGDYVTLTVGLENRSPASLKLQKWISAFRQMAGSEHEAVSTLIISGRDDANGTIDAVDLIAEKLETTLSDVGMDAGLRYVRGDRWRALARAYNGWQAKNIIPA